MTIEPDAPVETAVAVMRERGMRHLPVVDDADRLIGIVTDRDIRSAIFAPAFAEYLAGPALGHLRALEVTLEALRVQDVMTWGAVTIRADAPLAQAAAIMADARLGSLPVVEDDRLVGIVTEHDVLKALATTLPSIRGCDPDHYLW